MKKQFKKALSMVLSAAMVLTLGSGVELKSAKAAEVKTFDVSLGMNTIDWDHPASGTQKVSLANGTQKVELTASYDTAQAQGINSAFMSKPLDADLAKLAGVDKVTTTVSNMVVKVDGEAITCDGTTWGTSWDKKSEFTIKTHKDFNTYYFEGIKEMTVSFDITISGLPGETGSEPSTGSGSVTSGSGSVTSGSGSVTSGSGTTTSGGGAEPTEEPPAPTPVPPEPEEFTALINYADNDWAVQYWGEDADETDVVATTAKIKGAGGVAGGQYTVGLDFTQTEAGSANGIAFTDLEIQGAEPYHANRIIRLDEVKINGKAVPADVIAHSYTCSDNGIDTRVNLYNGWCPEDDAYATDEDGNPNREEARAYGDITEATPWLLEDYIDEEIETIEVTFTYAPEPDSFNALLNYADNDWAVQYWGEAADETAVVAKNAEVKGPGKYNVSLDFSQTEVGSANGIAFTDVEIQGAEDYHPDRVIRIDEVKINGKAVPADILAKAYTCSDNALDTRVNLYNGWCPEDDPYAVDEDGNPARKDARAYGDLTKTTPWMLEDYIDEEITTFEVSFTYGTKTEIEAVDNPVTPSQKPSPSTQPSTQPSAKPSATPDSGAAVGSKHTIKGSTYTVKSATVVEFTKAKKNASSVTIPATVKIKNKTYKVTSIKAKAFSGNKKLKSVVIGKNIKTIGKQAFFKCAKLKKIRFMSATANKIKIGKKAFAKGAKKPTVTIPKKTKKKALNTLKKNLKKAGLDKKAKYKKK